MRAKTIAALLAATAILGALAIPTGASAARSQSLRQSASVNAALQIRGTHGFRLDVFASGKDSGFVLASKRASKFSEETVIYIAPPSVKSTDFDGGLDLRIGRLGHFRGHFVPTSTKTRKPFKGCEGNPTTIETGFFVGSFDFRGERDYTSVHAHRVRGTVTRQGAAQCHFPPETEEGSPRQVKEEKEREGNEFRLVAGEPDFGVFLQASREEGLGEFGTPTTFVVSAHGGKAGKFLVGHSAVAFDFDDTAASTFQTLNLAEPLAEATLAPPAPFSGSATFHLDDPKTASWTGDLAVELPGLGEVPLTGKGIYAGLCDGRSHCTETLPGKLSAALESSAAGSLFVVSETGPKRPS